MDLNVLEERAVTQFLPESFWTPGGKGTIGNGGKSVVSDKCMHIVRFGDLSVLFDLLQTGSDSLAFVERVI